MTDSLCLDRHALQDLMLNYAAAVDDRDRNRYRDCFAEQLEVVGFGDRSFHDRDSWLDYVWTALDSFSATQHLLGPQLAEINGDSADTRSDVQALHVLAEGDGGTFILWATYLTRMQRIAGQWKIVRHELRPRGTTSLN
jgi:ketosteroid isomerase-like protein